MVDLTPIKIYIDDEKLNHSQHSAFSISRIGFDKWFDDQLNVFLNCTRISKDGRRCNQTNDKRYNYEMTTTVQMIEEFGEENKDDYYIRLINQHKINLEFEAINGFEYEPNKKKNNNKENSRRQTNGGNASKKRKVREDDTPRETAAERKLKAHAIKINALTFKPKSVNNGDIL